MSSKSQSGGMECSLQAVVLTGKGCGWGRNGAMNRSKQMVDVDEQYLSQENRRDAVSDGVSCVVDGCMSGLVRCVLFVFCFRLCVFLLSFSCCSFYAFGDHLIEKKRMILI